MKQKLIATLISTALVIAPLPAFTADSTTPAPSNTQGPLTPGKAAGVQQAQGGNNVDDDDVLFGVGFLAALGAGAWALGSNNDNGGGGTTPAPTPSPTTTTTTTTP